MSSSATRSCFESQDPERVLATLNKEENNIEGMCSDGESDFLIELLFYIRASTCSEMR